MASPALSIPYLRLALAGGTVLTYTNPKPWACLKISGCSYWHRTATLYWKNLPTNHYGIFYENDNCNTDADYFFASDISNPAGGSYKFKTQQAFGSMSVGIFKTMPSFTYVNNCPKDRENAMVNGTSVYLTSTSDDDGLSTNWNSSLS
ncbi:hypothetical protein P3T76_003022 [Phytophthora citrophthora]|uniref:Uncharacterized protein n=1 Tax=Phytophthora citrophthora TaxID=4793 RepID=A0AAD9GVP0_9STRA|nr:hypothetical protein P3T76_003022 [Phytophthora citrophthora]